MSCILRPLAKFARSFRKVFQRNKIEPDPTEDFEVSVEKEQHTGLVSFLYIFDILSYEHSLKHVHSVIKISQFHSFNGNVLNLSGNKICNNTTLSDSLCPRLIGVRRSHESEIVRSNPMIFLIVLQKYPTPSPETESEPSKKVRTDLRSCWHISTYFKKSRVSFLTCDYRTTLIQHLYECRT